jgi:Fe-S cluster biogenesis protein NfuA
MGIITNPEIISKIEGALTQVRPYLESDGGDIRLIEVTDDFVVKVKLLGACSDCQVSMMTLKAGVEQAIKKVLPEVKEVVDIDKIDN